MTPVIRPAGRNDIPSLIAVFQAAVRSCSVDYVPEQINAWAGQGTAARFEELFDSGLHFFLAESAAVCIGYSAVSALGELYSLFVAPVFKRQGVAGMLFNATLHFARDHGAQCLHADVSISALPFFRQAGFSVVREQQVFVGNISFTNYRMSRQI